MLGWSGQGWENRLQGSVGVFHREVHSSHRQSAKCRANQAQSGWRLSSRGPSWVVSTEHSQLWVVLGATQPEAGSDMLVPIPCEWLQESGQQPRYQEAYLMTPDGLTWTRGFKFLPTPVDFLRTRGWSRSSLGFQLTPRSRGA